MAATVILPVDEEFNEHADFFYHKFGSDEWDFLIVSKNYNLATHIAEKLKSTDFRVEYNIDNHTWYVVTYHS